MPDIVSYEDARGLGFKTYYTGVPCGYGHDALRYVSNKRCMVCVQASVRYYRNKMLRANPGGRKKLPGELAKWEQVHPLTYAEVDAWYERVRNMVPNSRRYKHQPLDERGIIFTAPDRRVVKEK